MTLTSSQLPDDFRVDKGHQDDPNPPSQASLPSISPQPPPSTLPPLASLNLPPTAPVITNGSTRKRGRLPRRETRRPPVGEERENRFRTPPAENLNNNLPEAFEDSAIPVRGFGSRQGVGLKKEEGEDKVDYSDEAVYDDLPSEHYGVDDFALPGREDHLAADGGLEYDFDAYLYDETGNEALIGSEAMPAAGFWTDFHGERDREGGRRSVPGVMEFGIAQSREDDFSGTWFRDGDAERKDRPKRDRDIPGGLVQLARTSTRTEWRQDDDDSLGATKYQVDAVYHTCMRLALSGVKAETVSADGTKGSRREKEDESITKSLREVEKVEKSNEKWMENAKPPAKRRRVRIAPGADASFNAEQYF